jgi:hypothetical protein
MADTYAGDGVEARTETQGPRITRTAAGGRRRLPSAGDVARALTRHRWLLAALAVGVAVPLIVAAATGGLSIPHNDGWAYSRIAASFARTGHIRLVGWNRSALVGQFLPSGPLGTSVTVQQSFVLLLALVGLVSVYDLLLPSLGPRNAGIATLMLALWPGFGLLDTSFMTDVPAMAAVFLCLALGRRALARDSLTLFCLAVLAGFWGTTIRAQTLAAPAALLLYAAVTRRARNRVRLPQAVLLAAVFLAGFWVFTSWYEGLPGGDLPPYRLVPSLLDTGVDTTLLTYFTVALPAAPAVFWAARPRRWGRGARITALATALVAVLAVHDHGKGLFPGNYLAQEGAYAHAAIGPTMLLPNWLWYLLVAIAMSSGSLLAGLIVHKARRADRLVALFTLAFTLGTVGTFLLGEFIYDRYLLEILPGVLAVALLPQSVPAQRAVEAAAPARPPRTGWARRSQGIAAVAAGAVVLGVGLLLMTNALTVDRQLWNEASALRSEGVPAMRIDAGLDWLGYHAAGGVIDRSPDLSARPLGYFTKTPACYVVSESRIGDEPGWTLTSVVSYHRYLITGTAHLYVYTTHAAGCPMVTGR